MPRALVRWLLPISLALNVFLLVVVAVVARSPHPPPDPRHMVERMAKDLPEHDAAILRAAFAAQAKALKQAEEGRRQMFERVRAALVAPTLDIDALRKAFEEGHVAHEQLEQAISGAIISASEQMSPEGRKDLAMRMPGSHRDKQKRLGDE